MPASQEGDPQGESPSSTVLDFHCQDLVQAAEPAGLTVRAACREPRLEQTLNPGCPDGGLHSNDQGVCLVRCYALPEPFRGGDLITGLTLSLLHEGDHRNVTKIVVLDFNGNKDTSNYPGMARFSTLSMNHLLDCVTHRRTNM
ncbi:hypothetical protein H920_14654 [Fukomys damarensis]|uniref:Uncharacterized protein n=1 Tax=Fukomys damarensis TaxID=885580 RepID=A0A091D0C5_FUKDA|nr:hypothetical protein H920_14654 [Fukomys damarensis]